MKYSIELLNTTHMPQAVLDIASRWIKRLQSLSKDVEADVENITSSSYVDDGEVEKGKIEEAIDCAVKSLIFLLEDTNGYNGRLLTLLTEIVSIQHKVEDPKSDYTWGFYTKCCQVVYDELFSSKKK